MWKLYVPGLGKCGVDDSIPLVFPITLFQPRGGTWIVLRRFWLDLFEVVGWGDVTPESALRRIPDL